MRSSAASRPSATPEAVQAMLKSKEAKLIDDHCCWCFGYNCSSRGHAPDACERRERPDMSDFRSSESVTRSESIRRATARSRQPHGRVQTRRTRVEQEAHRKRYTTAYKQRFRVMCVCVLFVYSNFNVSNVLSAGAAAAPRCAKTSRAPVAVAHRGQTPRATLTTHRSFLCVTWLHVPLSPCSPPAECSVLRSEPSVAQGSRLAATTQSTLPLPVTAQVCYRSIHGPNSINYFLI